MKKRGFTLVEMLAVVIILGLLLVVAIPQIQNQLVSKKEAVNEATLKLIYEAADSYLTADPSTFQKMYVDETNRSSYCIRLQDLVDTGKLEAPIKDFSTGEDLNLNYLVKATTNSYNEFEYSFVEDTKCGNESQTMVIYEDETLGEGTQPELYDGMIPVVYKNGIWLKASLYEVWYNYATGSKQWANVVTVNDQAANCGDKCMDQVQKHSRSYYERAIAGTKISMDDINGMYVWIPKYEYKITSPYGVGGTAATSVGTIDINLIAKTETNATSGYVIHPAFTFGSDTLGGIWVAKFEASADTSSLCYKNSLEENCNLTSTKLSVTPNKNSWRSIAIGNAYTVVKNMTENKKDYGLDATAVDTHLMKNTEWGAVAYLTQSKYGLGTEVYVNRYYNNGTLTGCTSGGAGTGKSITTSCDKLTYTYEASYKGSTTGNIYGIFDMSGGAYEYVMGNYNKNASASGIPLKDVYEDKENAEGKTEKVLVTAKIENKYFDIYPNTTCANTSCKGGALLKTELSLSGDNWWSDEYSFALTETDSWLIRGGNWSATDSKLLGIFATNKADGSANEKIGFRPVIVKGNA